MPLAGHGKVCPVFFFTIDAKRQIWLTMKSTWQLKLSLFPNILRSWQGTSCHSAILARRGNKQKVRHFRRHFDMLIELNIIRSVLRIEPTSSLTQPANASSGGSRPWAKGGGRGGGGFAFLALLPFIPSVISFFLPKIMGGGGPPGPSSRSATGTNELSNQTYLFIRPTGLTLSLNKNFEAILTLDVHWSSVF